MKCSDFLHPKTNSIECPPDCRFRDFDSTSFLEHILELVEIPVIVTCHAIHKKLRLVNSLPSRLKRKRAPAYQRNLEPLDDLLCPQERV